MAFSRSELGQTAAGLGKVFWQRYAKVPRTSVVFEGWGRRTSTAMGERVRQHPTADLAQGFISASCFKWNTDKGRRKWVLTAHKIHVRKGLVTPAKEKETRLYRMEKLLQLQHASCKGRTGLASISVHFLLPFLLFKPQFFTLPSLP